MLLKAPRTSKRRSLHTSGRRALHLTAFGARRLIPIALILCNGWQQARRSERPGCVLMFSIAAGVLEGNCVDVLPGLECNNQVVTLFSLRFKALSFQCDEQDTSC